MEINVGFLQTFNHLTQLSFYIIQMWYTLVKHKWLKNHVAECLLREKYVINISTNGIFMLM